MSFSPEWLTAGSAAVTALKSLLPSGKDSAEKELRSDMLDRIIDLQSALMRAQQDIGATVEENLRLKREIEAFQDWSLTDKSEYKLISNDGNHVVIKTSGDQGVFYCPTCFTSRTLTILQARYKPKTRFGGGYDFLACQRCTATFRAMK